MIGAIIAITTTFIILAVILASLDVYGNDD
jgi:hypothetical protein